MSHEFHNQIRTYIFRISRNSPIKSQYDDFLVSCCSVFDDPLLSVLARNAIEILLGWIVEESVVAAAFVPKFKGRKTENKAKTKNTKRHSAIYTAGVLHLLLLLVLHKGWGSRILSSTGYSFGFATSPGLCLSTEPRESADVR